MRREVIGNCELHLGDCMDILPTLQRVDAVVTDPPYGVMLGEINTGQARKKEQTSYEGFSDTPEYIKEKVIPAINMAIAISNCALITPGNRNLMLYPPYDDIGVWFNPAGSGAGRWGFILAHMILYYGKNPRAAKPGNGASSAWLKNERVGDINNIHPCPKPLNFMKWAVNKVSYENQIILDPFMGSGTTGVACIELKRKFIGIEINENYFNAACKRLKEAAALGTLDFDNMPESTPPPPIGELL
ncbi:DNA-methyltransferase [Treponema sp. R80B11-R83G3]